MSTFDSLVVSSTSTLLRPGIQRCCQSYFVLFLSHPHQHSLNIRSPCHRGCEETSSAELHFAPYFSNPHLHPRSHVHRPDLHRPCLSPYEQTPFVQNFIVLSIFSHPHPHPYPHSPAYITHVLVTRDMKKPSWAKLQLYVTLCSLKYCDVKD